MPTTPLNMLTFLRGGASGITITASAIIASAFDVYCVSENTLQTKSITKSTGTQTFQCNKNSIIYIHNVDGGGFSISGSYTLIWNQSMRQIIFVTGDITITSTPSP